MKAEETILKNLKADKALMKGIEKLGTYYNVEYFFSDAQRYVKALKQGVTICTINSVSRSGMSRTMQFFEVRPHRVFTFYGMFQALGYSESRKKDGSFTISGCGMDMVFHTNYTIVRELYRYGFISKRECDKLCQQTPTVL